MAAMMAAATVPVGSATTTNARAPRVRRAGVLATGMIVVSSGRTGAVVTEAVATEAPQLMQNFWPGFTG